jgi:hypothetical protein
MFMDCRAKAGAANNVANTLKENTVEKFAL